MDWRRITAMQENSMTASMTVSTTYRIHQDVRERIYFLFVRVINRSRAPNPVVNVCDPLVSGSAVGRLMHTWLLSLCGQLSVFWTDEGGK